MKKQSIVCRLVAAISIVAVGGLLLGAGAAPAPKDRNADAIRHSSDAAKVLNQIMGAPDKGIPRDLLRKANAVAVFPGVVSAAFIVGARGGQGVISKRTGSTWSTPAYFNLGGGSFGAQIGGSKTDIVMLIMNDEGLKGLLEDKFEMGGEASVAAGPVGRTAAATTNATLDAQILTYSRSKGLFAGVSLKGASITPDNDLNEAVYGIKAKDVLTGVRPTTKAPSAVLSFPQALQRYSR
jgi:lipid-binding SYLF domain-containing protein